MRKYEQKIHDIIYRSHSHLTAEDIFLELKKEDESPVLATIYNTLNAMYRDGKIHKVTVEGMPDRYDRPERHDHLICRRCGKLTDFVFTDFTEMLQREMNEEISGYDLRVYYLCPDCRKADS